MSIIIITSFFLSILLSIIGFGYLSARILSISIDKYHANFFGLFGIVTLTFISYITNLFVSHNFIHNILLLSIGLIAFIYGVYKDRIDFNDIKKILFLALLLILVSLLYKTHDDFDWYHLPYTLNIAQNKFQFGLGLFNHGFRTPSSLFYLNSLFYLPVIKFYSFNFAQLYIFLFVLIFFYKKIFFETNRKSIIFFLSLLSFTFISIVFYRLAEHGTDRSGQIFIFLIVIFILELINNEKININKTYLLLIFLTYVITVKTYFVIFSILFIPLLFKFKDDFKIYKKIIFSKITVFCIIFLILHFNIQLANTGCLLYPMNFTCYPNFAWSINTKEIILMQEWYELWSKSGANPNFRVENTSQYIAGFNWVSRWFDQYFFNKVSDLLGGIIAILIIYYFTFKSKNKEFLLENKKSTLVLLFIIFIISLIWFFKFPQLRYGGYAIAANIIFLPFCIYIINFSIDKKIIFKAKVIVILSLLIFISRNIDRIVYEIKFYEYRPIKSAFYKIENPEYKTIYSSDGVKLNITKGACWSIPQPCLRKEKIKAYKNKIYITYSKN